MRGFAPHKDDNNDKFLPIGKALVECEFDLDFVQVKDDNGNNLANGKALVRGISLELCSNERRH